MLMNNLLAIESSFNSCSVAIKLENNKIISDFQISNKNYHALLLSMIDKLIKKHDFSLYNCNAILSSIGPGNFTGLRISTIICKTLAFYYNIPIYPISSLALISQNIIKQKEIPQKTKILVAMDAKMNELYFGIYQKDASCVKSLYIYSIISNNFIIFDKIFL